MSNGLPFGDHVGGSAEVCANCGAAFMKPTARFCSRCGTKKASHAASTSPATVAGESRSGGSTIDPSNRTVVFSPSAQQASSDASPAEVTSTTAAAATAPAGATASETAAPPAPTSAEQEAKYASWSTLGPESITPEMLQTANADDLRQWRKGSVIGRGTYGSVYLGLLPDGGFHAVKCVELGRHGAHTGSMSALELVSLSREINMMQRLRHPNLCMFKGVYYDSETSSVCMFMEYIGGGSLSGIVKRFKPLPPGVVRAWTAQLLSGLFYLHAQGVIHRDVKGENVLIDTTVEPSTNAQVKLVDFGAARRLTDAVSQSRTVIGTPYWMAPEVVDLTGENKGYGYKADVWSVGCTVAEMLTGKPPWPCQANAPAAIMMIASAEGAPTEVPEAEATAGCHDFMMRCFERDPNVRPTVEELLQHPWITGAVE